MRLLEHVEKGRTRMSEENLDDLLKRMPEIATAVNGFTSETIQQEAFAALMRAYTGKHHSATKLIPQDVSLVEEVTSTDALNGSAEPKLLERRAKKTSRKPNGSGARENFRMVRDLDLKPTGKISFEEFAAEKQPKSNEDKYAVAVYWLEEIAERPAISAHHVGTIFRLMKWREPGALMAGLSMTSSRKATIDCSNADEIKITPQGRNFVLHDLPSKPKK